MHAHTLKDGRELVIREAVGADAAELLAYVHAISGESTFLSFAPGEFALSEAEEADFVERVRAAVNCVYLVGVLDGQIVTGLNFNAKDRVKVRHSGEFGMGVRKACWGLGVGGLMLDALIAWARGTGIVSKLNLHVRSDNARAIRLYEGRGFEREGTIRRDFVLDGVFYDHYAMGLVL